jgi:hypothetical protein
MVILKKIAAIIIILFTILFSFSIIYTFPILIERSKKKFEDGLIGAPGYVIGLVISFIFSVFIIYFLIKLSLKLIRQKKNNNALSIDKIGEEDIKKNFRNLVRNRLTQILIDYGYILTFDNQLEDQKVSKNWVFKLIYSGEKSIEINNDDYRDYTEYFYVKINEKEIMTLKIDKSDNIDDAFELMKTKIINNL